MTDTAIEIQNVSKRFKLYHNPITGPIKELVSFWDRKKYYKEFMAVRDVSITIRKGEIVGIIGPNGAGKTTLLKMIAGLLPVDKGRITLAGKVTALLTLGVGVHAEFTGRENIYYGGMLLGMSKEEVLRKTPEIIDFSELGDFIDSPFRTYSSGMKARLLFAISMSIDPDILIVDEALATGDTYFVQKCSQRIREICRGGATILFVSHNLRQIEELCQKAFLMDGGKIIESGEPSKVVSIYYESVFNQEKEVASISNNQDFHCISGNKEVLITEIKLINEQGENETGFYSGENMYMEIHYQRSSPFTSRGKMDLFVGFLHASTGQYVGEVSTIYYVESIGSKTTSEALEVYSEGVIKLSFEPLLLLNNHYTLWIILQSEGGVTFCEYRNVSPFFVARKSHSIARGPIFWQPAQIRNQKKWQGTYSK